MKKILIMVTVLLMLFSLVACSDAGEGEKSTPQNETSGEPVTGSDEENETPAAEKEPAEEASKNAVDNVEADWKENALNKAIVYQDDMAMSPNAVYDQLISKHGEQFTKEEAQYAIDNLPK